MNSPIASKTNKPVIISFIKLLMTEAQLNKLDELTEEEELIFLEKLIEEFLNNARTKKNRNVIRHFITLLMTDEQLNQLNELTEEEELEYLEKLIEEFFKNDPEKRLNNLNNQQKSTSNLSYLINKLLEKNDLTNILNKKMNKITLEGDELIISNFIDLLMKKEELSILTTLPENDKLSFLNQQTNEFFSNKINLDNIKNLLEKEVNPPVIKKTSTFTPGKKWKI